jgi:hypothetical protein
VSGEDAIDAAFHRGGADYKSRQSADRRTALLRQGMRMQ